MSVNLAVGLIRKWHLLPAACQRAIIDDHAIRLLTVLRCAIEIQAGKRVCRARRTV